jgi:toxin-antitoxin system PIN domain toxin
VILPDVNTLVYAFRRESPEHDTHREWLGSFASGSEELALADHCLAGMVRIVTHPRIFEEPAPTGVALEFVAGLRAMPRARAVAATDATWDLLGSWVADDRGIRGNLVPDAYLAALAVTHGARVASADRGFARFPGLEVVDPARAGR